MNVASTSGIQASVAATALNGKAIDTGLSIYKIVGIIAIFLIFSSIVSYSKDLFKFDISSLYSNLPFFSKPVLADPPVGSATLSYPSGPLSVQKTEAGDGITTQSWCLVGEDMTGRWCVQVPSEKSCDPERTYSSRNECERK